jgi:hypothetical protein
MAKDDRLELRLDAELRSKINELAALRGWPASAVVRRAILDAHHAAFPDAAVAASTTIVESRVVSTPAATITELHTALWRQPPTQLQQRLFDAHARGFTVGITPEQIDATLTVLFHLAPVRPDDPPFVLAPASVHAAILERVQAAVEGARGTEVARGIAQTIQEMKIGVPAQWPSEPPRVWVSVGVSVTDDGRGWLSRMLLAADGPKTEAVDDG